MRSIRNIVYSIRLIKKMYCLQFFCVLVLGCVEPFQTDFETFESYLVVEATITDELKNQEVKLSRTFELQGDGPNLESGAIISITSSEGNEYNFSENSSGVYISDESFQTLPEIEYQLNITTSSDEVYQSSKVSTPPTAKLNDLYAERSIDEFDGTLGLTFFVNSTTNSSEPLFFRFEYEETYKIVAPFWHPLDIDNVKLNEELFFDEDLPGPLYLITYVGRPEGEEVCYNTILNTEIITANTSILNENRLVNFPIKFEASGSIRLAERYSILVKQYVQTIEASTFYETLKSFSEVGNLFSQLQAGFVEGNIASLNNENTKVIGFFDISTLSSKRIFLDREDFFVEEDEIFEYQCEPSVPQKKVGEEQSDFVNRINESLFLYKFYAFEDQQTNDNLFQWVDRECGDCTVLGSSEKPDFWID